MGSFSRAFDKISSEYGWSDKKIKKLTIRRMRQIIASIDERKWMEAFAQRQLVAWQTRMTCSWMVKLTSDMDSEMANKLLEEASSISLDGAEPQQESNNTPVVRTRHDNKLPSKNDFYNMNDEEIERYLGTGENEKGSFESLRAGLGRSLSRHIK